MRIQVLGTGCAKCKTPTANAEQAARELGLEVTVEKVEDLRESWRACVANREVPAPPLAPGPRLGRAAATGG